MLAGNRRPKLSVGAGRGFDEHAPNLVDVRSSCCEMWTNRGWIGRTSGARVGHDGLREHGLLDDPPPACRQMLASLDDICAMLARETL